jgi:hypothetical protein
MRRTIAAAVLGVATAAAAQTPPASAAAAPKPKQATAAATNAQAAPKAPNADAIAKVKDFAKRESDRLAPKAGRAEKIVKDQAPKAIDKLVDFAADWSGAAPRPQQQPAPQPPPARK